jgi:hypothetical protein
VVGARRHHRHERCAYQEARSLSSGHWGSQLTMAGALPAPLRRAVLQRRPEQAPASCTLATWGASGPPALAFRNSDGLA